MANFERMEIPRSPQQVLNKIACTTAAAAVIFQAAVSVVAAVAAGHTAS